MDWDDSSDGKQPVFDVIGVREETVEQVLDARILCPDDTQEQLASKLNVSRKTVGRVLRSSYARHRLKIQEQALQARIRQLVEDNAELSLKYQSKALKKGIPNLEKAKPNPVLAHEAGKAASDTLRGTGVFQEYVTQRDSLTGTDIATLLEKQEKLTIMLQEGVGRAREETQGEGEVHHTPDSPNPILPPEKNKLTP